MHVKRGLRTPFLLMGLFYLVVLFTTFHGCYSAAFSKQQKKFGSSVVFPVIGNVYPKGNYQVTMNIGQPPEPYFLDIDTGSDLTWLQCDAPCTKCIPAPHSLYKPKKNMILCQDPICATLHGSGNHPCESSQEQCDYEVEYADQGSSMGVLVKDTFPLKFTNGTLLSPQLAFGCGYDQEVPQSNHPPFTDGVLGLGGGNSSIVAQLHNLRLSRNVVGHCFSARGGGFLFFGDDLVPSSGFTWAPLSQKSTEKHYSLGPADLLFGGQKTGIKGIPIIFDSGSTYSYLSSPAYNTLVSLIREELKGKQLEDAVEDRSLPVCWKGPKPFKSVIDAKSYFEPIVLSFTNAKNVQLQMPPEAYLIATGNVCLGILNGGEVGLGNINVIGDISMQDKIVIYDYEKKQIGWLPANCDRLPNVDCDYHEGVYQPYAGGMSILEDECPAKFGTKRKQTSK